MYPPPPFYSQINRGRRIQKHKSYLCTRTRSARGRRRFKAAAILSVLTHVSIEKISILSATKNCVKKTDSLQSAKAAMDRVRSMITNAVKVSNKGDTPMKKKGDETINDNMIHSHAP